MVINFIIMLKKIKSLLLKTGLLQKLPLFLNFVFFWLFLKVFEFLQMIYQSTNYIQFCRYLPEIKSKEVYIFIIKWLP